MTAETDRAEYWEQRLRSDFSLDGVGYQGLGVAFNEALYRQRARVLSRALRRFGIEPAGATVVELGPGTGYWVREWQRRRAANLVGLDISSTAAARLQEEFPAYRFEQADVSEPWPVDPGSADIVTAFDVLFHILDDDRFRRAIEQAGRALRPGGWFLLTDLFPRREPLAGEHQVSRLLRDYVRCLRDSGMEVVGRLPIFVLMHPPYDLPAPSRNVAVRSWSFFSRWLKGHPGAGRWVGPVLSGVDRVATAMLREGPSTELLVARRH